MLSVVNMRVFKSLLLLLAVLFFNGIECLPLSDETSSIAESPTTKAAELSSANDDHYDQRQNGTDNYRIHVDGVVLAFAPVEALLLAGGNGIDKPSLTPIPEPSKPTPDKPPAEPRPSPVSKPSNRAGINLANLLVPFLRRLRQE